MGIYWFCFKHGQWLTGKTMAELHCPHGGTTCDRNYPESDGAYNTAWRRV